MVMELIVAKVDLNHMEEVSVTLEFSLILLYCMGMLLQGGLSALMLCCEEGNLEMTELLLNSHADPNLQQSVIYMYMYKTTIFTYVYIVCNPIPCRTLDSQH